VRRPEPDKQLTLGGVGRPELLGSLVAHVAPPIRVATRRSSFRSGLSSTNEPPGTTCGLPSSRAVVTLAVRVPSMTNARHSCSVILRTGRERTPLGQVCLIAASAAATCARERSPSF
jgi:hypothetical protein